MYTIEPELNIDTGKQVLAIFFKLRINYHQLLHSIRMANCEVELPKPSDHPRINAPTGVT